MSFIYTALLVDDIAALKALSGTSTPKRVDGLFVEVKANASGQPSWYLYNASSSASESLPWVVAPTDGIGRYFVFSDDQKSYSRFAVPTQSDVVADSKEDTVTFVAGSGMTITTNATNDEITFASSSSANAFTTFAFYDNVADDTLNITPDSTTDTITFRAVGGSGIRLVPNTSTDTVLIQSTVNNFGTISTPSGSVVASDHSSTLTFAGTNIDISASGSTVTLAAGTNVALKNLEQVFTNTQRMGIVNNSFSSSITADLSLGNVQEFTLTGNLNLTATNLRSGAFYEFTFIQGGSGSYTVTFDSAKFKFPNDVLPTLTTAVGSVTEISCRCNGTVLRCSPGLPYSA